MNSITCLFFDARSDNPQVSAIGSLASFKPICCQFVTRDAFNKGKWQRLGNLQVTFPESEFPYRETKRDGWIGAKVIGSGIIASFLTAFYGIEMA
jgi:hypothetical protein